MTRALREALGPVFLLLALVAALWSLAWASSAWGEPDPDSSKVTREWAGALNYSESFCVDVTDAAADLLDRSGWAAAVQTRIPTSELGEVRYVEVLHSDSTDSSVDVCLALGTSLGSSVTCDPAGSPNTTGSRITAEDQSRIYHVRRTKQRGATTGALPALWAVAPAGQTVTVCLTLGG